jgi:NADH-quinone oxidoreductase subunit K
MVPTLYYLMLGAVLFTLGAAGVLTRRNAIMVLMSIELMLNAVNLTLLAMAAELDSITGAVLVFLVITVAAAEVAIGLALVVLIQRTTGQADVDAASRLRG